MKINENEEIKEQKHDWYEEFKLRQTTFNFENTDETFSIIVKDKDGNVVYNKTYKPDFINCHINLTFQDKGTKADESLYEYVKVKKEK